MDLENIKSKAISVDLKVTDYCDYGCNFCYQNSKITGKHADLDYVKRILDFLNENDVLEIVVGGGEPTKYPYIFDVFLETVKRRLFFSLTTKNLNFAQDIFTYGNLYRLFEEVKRNRKNYLQYYVNSDYVNSDGAEFSFSIGVGFSPTPGKEYIEVKNLLDNVENFYSFRLYSFTSKIERIIRKERYKVENYSLWYLLDLDSPIFDIKFKIKIHLIEGIHFKSEKDLTRILRKIHKAMYNNSIFKEKEFSVVNLGVLLLGYKRVGRGKYVVAESDIASIAKYLNRIKFLYLPKRIHLSKIIPLPISVDSVLVEKLKKHIDIYEESIVQDGFRTFYIDAVNKKFAQNSFTDELFDLKIWILQS